MSEQELSELSRETKLLFAKASIASDTDEELACRVAVMMKAPGCEKLAGFYLCIIKDASPAFLRKVARALETSKEEVEGRDLKISQAYSRASRRSKQVADLIAGPTFADVKEEFKKCSTAKVCDFSMRRSLARLKLTLRNGKRGRPATK